MALIFCLECGEKVSDKATACHKCGCPVIASNSNQASSCGPLSIESIPTHGGLAALAFLVGFGVIGGMVLGSHFRTKKLIASGDYDAALQASNTTFWGAIMVIVGVPVLIGIIFLGNIT